MTATEQLAERATRMATDASAEDLDRAAHAVLDHLTCALVGVRLPYAQPHFAALADLTSRGQQATCWDGTSRPALVAAYLNAQAANALDFDDTLIGHPGAPVIATALAVAEAEERTVGDLLRGVVAGYETHWVLARAALPTPARARRVRGVGVWDAVAAAVAAAVTTGRTAEQVVTAIELAATHSCLPYVAKWYERPVPTVKNNLGWSAAAAILTHELASAGARGIPQPLDGPAGMWLMAGSDRWEWDSTLADHEPAMQKVGFKRFPACWHLQSYLTVIDAAVRQAGDTTGVDIEISGPAEVVKFVPTEVSGPAEVAFSLPTLTALLLLGVPPGPAWVQPDTIKRAGTFRDRVRFNQAPHRQVRLTSAAGHRSARVPKGDFMRPRPLGLTDAEVRDKFSEHVTPLVGSGATRAEQALLDRTSSLTVAQMVESLR